MCTVVMDRNLTNDRFIIVNTILSRKEIFSKDDIVKELQFKGTDINELLEDCVEDLLDNGLIFEIGSKYRVKDRQKRWSMM